MVLKGGYPALRRRRPALIEGQVYRNHAKLGHVGGQHPAMVIFEPCVLAGDGLCRPAAGMADEGERPRPDHRSRAPGLDQGMERRDAQDRHDHLLHARDGRLKDVGGIIEIGKADHRGTEGCHLEQKGPWRTVQNGKVDAQARPGGKAQDKKFGRVLQIGDEQDRDHSARRDAAQAIEYFWTEGPRHGLRGHIDRQQRPPWPGQACRESYGKRHGRSKKAAQGKEQLLGIKRQRGKWQATVRARDRNRHPRQPWGVA